MAESADAAAAAQAEEDAEADAMAEQAMRAALAAKGYDLVEKGSDSDDDDLFPGRITALDPGTAREKGKAAFEKGKYDRAIRYWQGGLKSILSSLCAGPQALGDQNLSELDLTLNLNIAMAHMKKQDYDMADRSVDKALARRDALPPNLITKALYRKASAQRAMHRLEECLGTLKDLLEVEPGNTAGKQMQLEVEREWKLQCRKQKSNMKKMFEQLSGEDKQEAEKLRAERRERRRLSGVTWIEGDDVDSEAFERGDTPACNGRDWGMALTRTVAWSIEQIALETGVSALGDISSPAGSEASSSGPRRASAWFLGVSSTCELRWLQPSVLLARLPGVELIELALIGFLGELGPDNKKEPDPKADSLTEGVKRTASDDGRVALVHVIKGTLDDALEKQLKPASAESSEATGPAEGGDGQTGEQWRPMVPPSVCFIAHPQLHRYFSDFFPAIAWLIEHEVPTVIIGASEPDPSWKQDEVLLKSLGCNIIVSKRESPYPMCLPDNSNVKKCSHIIAFKGGKAIERDRLVRTKLDLLAQDYNVR